MRADTSVYSLEAAVVLPMLLAELPPPHKDFPIIGDDYVLPAGWIGETAFHWDRIRQCPPDEQLVVQAWDQS